MATTASVEELGAVQADLDAFKAEHPKAHAALVALLERHRKVGYRNICRLALGATPAELKE